MTVSSHLGVAQTLDLVENLKATVRDFAAREEKLNNELRTKVAAARHRRDAATEATTNDLSTAIAKAEAAYEAEKTNAELRFERRKAAIVEAHRLSKKKALHEIENKEGSRKHKLQTETLQSQRSRETGLANVERTWEEFKNGLAADNQTLLALEKKAQNSFRGYGKFLRLLRRAAESAAPDLTRDEYQLITE